MPLVTFVDAQGSTTEVQASAGLSVMQAAVTNGLPGIAADCGGAASCATCHVYVDPTWLDRLSNPSEDEEAMLDCTASERRPNSRLSCQIPLSDELDGLVVMLPDRQS